MPIRHFEFYISERQLVQTSPLSQLKGSKIGFEGQYWLRKIIKPSNITRMSNAEAKTLDNITANIVSMGGTFPYTTFKNLLEREINKIRSFDIYPFFVFNGLSFYRKDKPFSTEDTRPNKRSSGWDHYDKGRLESAFNTWSSSGSVHQNEFMNSVFKIFQENNVEFMRAPFSSWSQLAYLEHRGYVQSVYSGNEMLMWSGDNDIVILNIDFEKKEFTWIEKMRVIHDLNMVSPDQFIDVCMLAGFDWISTFPPLVGGGPNASFTFKGTVDMIAQYKTGYNAVQAFAEHPNVKKLNYEDTFCRIKSIIKHNIILKEDGTVEPLNKESAPNDLHELFGPRLPDEVYFFMCQGMISPQVVTNLVSGMLLEGPPLCNGDTIEYREFIRSKNLLELRTQALSLLTHGMSPFMKSRKVNSIFWFDPNHEIQLHHESEPIGNRWLSGGKGGNDDSTNTGKNNNSNKNSNLINNSNNSFYSLTNTIDWMIESKKKENQIVNFMLCLQAISSQASLMASYSSSTNNINKNNNNASSTTANTNNNSTQGNNNKNLTDLKYIRSTENIYGLVLMRFLEARNFIKLNNNIKQNIGTYIMTPYGKALQKALSNSSTIFQEEIISAIELIRMNILTNKPYTKIPYIKLGSSLASPITPITPTSATTTSSTTATATTTTTTSSTAATAAATTANTASSTNKDINEVQGHINLISRVASLLHINFKHMSVWTGPLDLELVRFNSIAKAVNRSLRNLCEMLLLSMVMNENAGKGDTNLEVLCVGIKLPFLLDSNTANGIITMTYLNSLTDIINITPEVIQKATNAIETKFIEYCPNIKEDMQNTYQLWDRVVKAVKILKSEGQISNEYANEFLKADEWLKGKKPMF